MGKLQAKAYILGIPRIDEQHMMFLQMTQTLREFIANSSDGYQPNQLLSLILRFRNYAFYHFHTEETMMFEKKFPGFFAQKDAHNQFLIEMIAFEEKFEVAYRACCHPGIDKTEADAESGTKRGADVSSAGTQGGEAQDGEKKTCSDEAVSLLELADEMNEFVSLWYTKHILEMDKDYVEYLR